MEYKFKYNERPHFDNEENHGVEDIPSAKAVQDTAVEERDGKVVKSRRQSVCGREYIVLAEFAFRGCFPDFQPWAYPGDTSAWVRLSSDEIIV